MNTSTYFHGKKITLIGLGLLGRGLGDAKYLASCGSELIITDLKSEEELVSSLAQLKEFSNIRYTLNKHKFKDFQNRDMVIKAAGVPLDSPYIREAEKNGIVVRMSADLFLECAGIPAIGITGTRGKSTVTHMIAAILKEAEKPIVLGGNIRGVSNLQLLDEITPQYTAVLELDSWQLQGFGVVSTSPHIAVFTTFYPDHLNYYQNSLDTYLADKANIFRYQNQDDTLIIGTQAAGLVKEKYGLKILSKLIVIDTKDLPSSWQLKIPGEHNRYNAALALATARAYGIADEVSRLALETFKGVPGRLELIRKVNGVKIYNDTTATTPEATITALEALDIAHKQNIILIMGGADKELSVDLLQSAVYAHTKKVFFLAGSGTDHVRGEEPVFNTLSDVVSAAYDAATPGDIILFSPAFASFNMFKNEFDRGDQFNMMVKDL